MPKLLFSMTVFPITALPSLTITPLPGSVVVTMFSWIRHLVPHWTPAKELR